MNVDAYLFALAASVDPLMLTMVVILLSRPRPGTMLTSFLAGGYLAATVAGLLIIEGLGSLGFHGLASIPAIPRVVVGVLLLVAAPIGYRHIVGRPEGAPPPAWMARFLERSGPVAVFALGAVVSLPGGSTLAGLAAIAATHPSTPSALVQLFFFNLILFLTAEIPLAVHILKPSYSARVIGGLRGVMLRFGPRVGLVVLVGLGLVLIVTGVGDL
jgi:hypothetical protein